MDHADRAITLKLRNRDFMQAAFVERRPLGDGPSWVVWTGPLKEDDELDWDFVLTRAHCFSERASAEAYAQTFVGHDR